MTAKHNRATEDNEQQPSNGEDTSAEQARSEGNAKAAAEEAARLAEEAAHQADDGGRADAESELEDAESKLQAEITDLKERLQRAMAETENVRRRADRERQEAVKYAAAPLAKDLLGVADNLRRALESVPQEKAEQDETVKNLLSGVEMTEKELASAFDKHGIEKIAPEAGERFDPHRHEAMYEVPTDDHKPGSVVQVVQEGYILNDRLLRPARVGVAKSASGSQAGGPGGSVDTKA